jgi:hypothetical protein
MTIDLDELERLATAATPGEWEEYGELDVNLPYSLFSLLGPCSRTTLEPLSGEDRSFIVAAQPSVILSLVSEIRRLREENERLDGLVITPQDAKIARLREEVLRLAHRSEQYEAVAALTGADPTYRHDVAGRAEKLIRDNARLRALLAEAGEALKKFGSYAFYDHEADGAKMPVAIGDLRVARSVAERIEKEMGNAER